MIEPTLALQTAIRGDLVARPALTALVPADHIRAGNIRPEKFPAIIITDSTTQFLGRAAGFAGEVAIIPFGSTRQGFELGNAKADR